MKKISLLIFIMALSLAGIFAFGKEDNMDFQNPEYTILQKWDLPKALDEVSGIEWIDENTIAAVQDEEGIIFIYDLETSEIKKEIEFNGAGDYEGIRVSNKDAFILKSDGTIIKVADYLGTNPQVTEHRSALSSVKGIDVEGLGLDRKNARLLLAEKEKKQKSTSRGIYAVTLNLKDSWDQPAIKLDLEDAVLQKVKRKTTERFFPSEITTHPKNDNYYLLDGRNPKLLILQPGGKPEKIYILNKKEFEQPEGITFDPAGNLYISNEAGDEPANILKVSLR